MFNIIWRISQHLKASVFIPVQHAVKTVPFNKYEMLCAPIQSEITYPEASVRFLCIIR